MIVVADASPLNYLILIGAADVLPALYGSIRIAPAVASELSVAGAPDAVRRWFETKPDWLAVTAPQDISDPRLAHLDAGEREAITLAIELRADLMLMDERDGRASAQACGLASILFT